jgi:hypothetical protein
MTTTTKMKEQESTGGGGQQAETAAYDNNRWREFSWSKRTGADESFDL